MPNICLTLEYSGAGFHGWQKQPGIRTIQSEMERVLEIALKQPIETLYAASRTDAGVHARGQVVNFHVPEMPDLHRLTHSLSSLLKGEVSVVKAEVVGENFIAQRDAKGKLYTYTILHRKAPAVLEKGRAWHISGPLDIERMQIEAASLVGTHDFTSFRASGCFNRSPVKTVYMSQFTRDGDLLIYRIVGSGFLKQMVRNIVGTLVLFGRGIAEQASILELLKAKDRKLAGPTAPAGGLCLEWIAYEEGKLQSELLRLNSAIKFQNV